MCYTVSLTAAEVPPVAVKFSPEDYTKLKKIAESDRAPLASVVRRFVGECLDKYVMEA